MKKMFMMVLCLIVISTVVSAAGTGLLKFTATVTAGFDGDIAIYLRGDNGEEVTAWLNPSNGYSQDKQVTPGTYTRMFIEATGSDGEKYKVSGPTEIELYEDGLVVYDTQLFGLESVVGPTDPVTGPEAPPPVPTEPETPEEAVKVKGFWGRMLTVDNVITLVIILILGGIYIRIKVKKTMYQDVE